MSKVREVVVPGARLSVEIRGEGSPALVMLHGLASDRRSWDRVVAELGLHTCTIRYDLRGSGQSVASDDKPFRHASDLHALLDAMGVECCDLLGVSLGGAIALNFALDHPRRVRRLVLVSPGITAWDWSDEWRTLWAAITDAARSVGVARARELWWEHPLFASTRVLPEAAEKFREMLESDSGAAWLGQNTEAPALPDLDRLPLLAPPCLLLTGTADLPDFRLIAQFIESAVPQLRRVDYDHAGHLLNLERPCELATEIARFLK
ncbi:MAG TPA: alpha/beta hydrolase [Solimonas sp.]